MSFKRALPGLLAVLVVVALALPAFAQETSSGTLEGRVTDDKGQSIPGATISATGGQGLQASRTDADGKFKFPFLKSGKYEVKVEAPGYATIVLKDVEVQLSRRTSLPIQMSAGRVETVEVRGEAPIIDQKSTSDRGEPQGRRLREHRSDRPHLLRHVRDHARRGQRRRDRLRQLLGLGLLGPREPVHRGRREHHQHRLRRHRLVQHRLRLARHRRDHRLPRRGPGQDRRLRGRVRRRHGRHHHDDRQERHQRVRGERQLLLHPQQHAVGLQGDRFHGRLHRPEVPPGPRHRPHRRRPDRQGPVLLLPRLQPGQDPRGVLHPRRRVRPQLLELRRRGLHAVPRGRPGPAGKDPHVEQLGGEVHGVRLTEPPGRVHRVRRSFIGRRGAAAGRRAPLPRLPEGRRAERDQVRREQLRHQVQRRLHAELLRRAAGQPALRQVPRDGRDQLAPRARPPAAAVQPLPAAVLHGRGRLAVSRSHDLVRGRRRLPVELQRPQHRPTAPS